MADTSTIDRSAVLRVPAGRPSILEAVARTDVDVARVGPTGISALDPLVTATVDGRTGFYPRCDTDRALEAATDVSDGSLADGGAVEVVEHDPDAITLPTPPIRGLGVGDRRLLGGAGWRRPTDPDDHAGAGGFVDADPGTIASAAEGLRGRGWGDWRQDEPVLPDWNRRREAGPTAAVVNAHGSVADTVLCESVPFEVLEGGALLAEYVGAERVTLYVSAEAEVAADRLRAAAGAYPGADVAFDVVTGPDVHRAAEPTMALEAIEGNHRLEARLRTPDRPLPTLDGTPALVHTARTSAHLARSVRTDESPETRLVTVSGDVATPATVELEQGSTIDAALAAVEPTDRVKAACVGGRFGGLTTSFDVSIDPEALADAGLGAEGAIEVLGEDRCVLSFAGTRSRFAADANCGRCVPCREGTTQLTELLRDVYDSQYEPAKMEELIRTMESTSVCAFGVQAGRPARTALAEFSQEIEAHARGRCPANVCFETAEVSH